MSLDNPIIKNTIHLGRKYVPISHGCKVHFHFQTWKLGEEKILIDDSKKIGKREPMVLIIGHKFKLEVWETVVKLMAVGEVSSFHVKKELVYSYPFVSKTLRELGQENHKIKHMCTMTLHKEGIGYKDLDDLIKNPCDLEFVIELLEVERSDEYEKDIWQLSVEERLELIPKLKEKGNKLYGQKLYDEAEAEYSQAIAICEEFMNKERKQDDEWKKLNVIKLPILLNYIQCKLVKKDYYSVIEHSNTILQYDEDNEKALYRRGKAHVGVWNLELAEKDFNKLKLLNPKMEAVIDKELKNIIKLYKEKKDSDKNAYRKLFTDSTQY